MANPFPINHSGPTDVQGHQAGRKTELGSLDGNGKISVLADVDARLVQALRDMDSEACLAALRDGANPDVQTFGGYRPLHFAAQSGSPQLCRILIAHGADVNAKGFKNYTPLELAAGGEASDAIALEMLKPLVEAGARPEESQALHRAAASDNRSKSIRYLAYYQSIDSRGGWDQTPLHAAVIAGKAEHVGLLLGLGADVNARCEQPSDFDDLQGLTSLHIAAFSSDLACCKMLLKADSDINAMDSQGRTPLSCAVSGYPYDNADDELRKNSEETARRFALVELLVSHGADSNIFDNCRHSPLYCSLSNKVMDIATYLMENGANINHRNESDGFTALHEAVWERNTECARRLLALGADPELRNANGKTALDLAEGTTKDILTAFAEKRRLDKDFSTFDEEPDTAPLGF